MPHAPAGPGAFPPDEQLTVLSIATSTTQSHDRPVNGWTLDEIAATILNEAHAQTISRATIWRILDQADHPRPLHLTPTRPQRTRVPGSRHRIAVRPPVPGPGRPWAEGLQVRIYTL